MASQIRVTDKGLSAFIRKFGGGNTYTLYVGVFDGEHTSRGKSMPMIELAEKMEFGFRHPSGQNVPARSFIGSYLEKNKIGIRRVFANYMKEALHNPAFSLIAAWLGAGETLADEIKIRILDGEIAPPIKSSTVRRKQDTAVGDPSTPLLETGQLAASIRFIVTQKKTGGGKK